MMILNKEEAVILIKDLAEMAVKDERARDLFKTVEEHGAYVMGVAHLEMELLKRIQDYV